MIATLKTIYFSAQFENSLSGFFLNPFFLSRKSIWEAMVSVSTQIKGKTLDVGCGTKPYAEIFKCADYIGMEYDSPISRAKGLADTYYDGKKFPFSDNSFESLISNQVLEHVFNPEEFLQECNRVLKPGGIFVLSVPFVWEEHEQPYDFGRYSSFGLSHICQKNGFEILDQKRLNTGILAISQLTASHLYKSTIRLPFIVRQTILSIFCPIIFLMGYFLAKITPKNDDLFLDNFFVLKKS